LVTGYLPQRSPVPQLRSRNRSKLLPLRPCKAGTAPISITASQAQYIQGSVAEYAGAAATSPLDQCITAHGQSGTGSAGPTGTLATDGELVFAATVNGNPEVKIQAGNGFTLRSSDGYDACEDTLTATTDAESATMRFSTKQGGEGVGGDIGGPPPPQNPDWNMVVATFKP
jgi:hypothetical protein